MGLLSWLFPSDSDHMDQAEKYLARGDFGQARQALDGIEGDRAESLRAQAHEGLKDTNLQLAVACATSGELERAQEHLELAETFAKSGDPALRGARRAMREARAAQQEQKAKGPAPALGSVGGIFGGNMQPAMGPGPVGEELPADADALFSLPPDDPRIRFALLLEQYPESVRERFVDLGEDFATAVLAIEDGHFAHAVDVLQPFAQKDPVARFERGRAALEAGKFDLAVSELRSFGQTLGHQQMGPRHSALLLAAAFSRQAKPAEALRVLDEQLAKEPSHVGLGANKAFLLEATGKLPEADELARKLVTKAPREMGLYKLMARCRVKAGKRMEAMQVLEAGLTTNCTSGKCGSLPFDVEAGRMLAQLYLEDRIESQRAAELIGRIKGRLKEPSWFEGYLEALSARNSDSPQLQAMLAGLGAGLREGDPRQKLIEGAFSS